MATALTRYNARPDETNPADAPHARTPHEFQPTVALVTPWKQVCGNAQYAEKLATGLSQFARIVPIVLVPYPFPKAHFLKILSDIKASRADVVHIQHEYYFFGPNVVAGNRQFNRLIAQLDAPVVVTLHTVREDILRFRSLSSRILQLMFNALTVICNRVNRRSSHLVQRVAQIVLRRFDVFLHALRRCEMIVVHSDVSAKYLKDAHPELANKIKVVPIPVTDIRPADQPPLVKPAQEVWLMMLGFVSEYKGHLQAIGALRHLPPNYRLVVAGGRHPNDPHAFDYWSRLLAAIDFAQLRDRVTFTGFIADEREYAAVLGLADAFLLPYQEVGQSASAVLADVMNFGKPVVTSTARSMWEYRYDSDSFCCSLAANVDDAEAFAAQIRFALAEGEQPAPLFRDHMQHVIRNCSLKVVSAKYEQIYCTLRRAP
jgi:glycosyltransferase involved in cell wall biosynthesis